MGGFARRVISSPVVQPVQPNPKPKPPKNIPIGGMTEFRQAMFEHCKDPNPIKAYRKYYHEKTFKMVWTNRDVPSWYSYK